MKTYDAIVIGGGPGGYPCAIKLGQLGLKVACVEMDKPGGACLNWGCIPSKALIYASGQYEKTKGAATIGVKCTGIELDVPAMQAWKDGIVTRLNTGIRQLLKGAGVDYFEGVARLTGKGTVEVTGAGGELTSLLSMKGIVLATGASTIEIPSFKFDGHQIVGAKEGLSLRAVPKRLLVIGGGVIGLELGTVYQKLGSALFIAEALPTLLTGHDQDAVKLVERKLLKHGAKIFKKARAVGYEKSADGSLKVTLDHDGKTVTLDVDAILVAVGMRPNTKGLGLEQAGVIVDGRGFIVTDLRGETNVKGIYAVGDVSGPPLLAHKASREGEIVAEVIAGHNAAKDWVAMPASTFTDPEISSVGISEEDAKAKGLDVKVGKFPFAALGKAMAIRETDGFVKVIADAKTTQILGVHIVGPEASSLISEAALAIEMAGFIEDVTLTIHPHPTLSEALMEAAAHAIGKAIHIPNR
ncbi:MAG: dihydrolipoyl dehydrogenase [Myxococcales bacterium]|nr:dihydrolipoyl dehydrogenase [Myxococcales bacterium]